MIYFDNAATTFMCDAARKVLMLDYGNPSSPHAFGIEAERVVKTAAKDIAEILSCKRDELIFTSGGTEANNLGILGVAYGLKFSGDRNRPLRILASNHEHPSVTGPLEYLQSLPGFSVTYESPSRFCDSICRETDIVCVTQVSSETGDVFELNEIKSKFPSIVVFVDGCQSFCKIPPPLKADIYSFSGHKIHGPMGVGGLMVRKSLRLQPMMYGGGQQTGIRPGTENVQGILAMAAAAKAANFNSGNNFKVERIKKTLMELTNEMPDVYVNETSEKVSPYILNMSFINVNGETLTNMLSAKGICVSMGTACRSVKKENALEGLGISRDRAVSAIRFSFSYMNTEEEAVKAKTVVRECVEELRKIHRRS